MAPRVYVEETLTADGKRVKSRRLMYKSDEDAEPIEIV